MISMRVKYALRALTVLAKSGKKMLPAKTLALEGDIPVKFLEAILGELRRHHFVESKRGIFGGYYLARPPEEIVVGDIIRVLDGPLAPIRCASVTAYQRCEDCPDEAACALRKTMIEVRNAISGVLDACTLAQFAARDGVA